MSSDTETKRRLLRTLDNILNNPTMASEGNREVVEAIIARGLALEENLVQIPQDVLGDILEVFFAGFDFIQDMLGNTGAGNDDVNNADRPNGIVINIQDLRRFRRQLVEEIGEDDIFCYKCRDHKAIEHGSLCRNCLHQINSTAPPWGDGLAFLAMTVKASTEAFEMFAQKTGIYMRVDNRAVDEHENPTPYRRRLFVQETDLVTARSFLETLCTTAKTRGESLETGITTATVQAAYINWQPPATK